MCIWESIFQWYICGWIIFIQKLKFFPTPDLQILTLSMCNIWVAIIPSTCPINLLSSQLLTLLYSVSVFMFKFNFMFIFLKFNFIFISPIFYLISPKFFSIPRNFISFPRNSISFPWNSIYIHFISLKLVKNYWLKICL